jgi:SSS family solute:Na+ symporter
MISRVLSAKDSNTAKKIYKVTSPYMLMRFVIPVFLGISALYLFGANSYGDGKEILAMPNMIAQIIPVGLIGIVIAAMLAADMSTNSSYLIAWSSVIYNDILAPIHKNKWSSKKGLFYNRFIICCIGLFLLLYGLWYPLNEDLWVYMQVTGTIYLSSMSVLLIACCYFKNASSLGAAIAIIIGALIPVSYLFLQDFSFSSVFVKNIGPYKFGVLSFLLSSLGMVVGSLITKIKSK